MRPPRSVFRHGLALGTALAILVLSQPAFAEAPQFPQDTQVCVRAAAQSDADPATLKDCALRSTRACQAREPFVSCAEREMEFWRGLLDQTLASFLGAAAQDHDRPHLADALSRSQKAWEIYVEAHCHAVERAMLGGSGAAPEELSCQLNHIVARIIALQGLD